MAVSLYRQHFGAGGEPGGQGLKVFYLILLRSLKSLKTTRLAQRPHKDHKGGQPQKGNLDEAGRIHPIHKAQPARQKGSKETFCCNGSQGSFPGLGGVVDVQGFRAEDRAHTSDLRQPIPLRLKRSLQSSYGRARTRISSITCNGTSSVLVQSSAWQVICPT